MIATLNEYKSTHIYQSVYNSPILANGSHTLTLKNVSAKYMTVDAIQILFPTPSDIPAVADQGNLHLFALMGQSNMSGIDAVPTIQQLSPTIYNFAKN